MTKKICSRWAAALLVSALSFPLVASAERAGEGRRPSELSSGKAEWEAAENERAVLVFCAPRGSSSLVRTQYQQALATELGDLPVEIQWASPNPANLEHAVDRAASLARERDAVAVVWLDAVDGGLMIFLYESRGPYLRQRFIPVASSVSGADEVALVLRSALTSIVEWEDGMSEAPISLTELDGEETPESAPSRPGAVGDDSLLNVGVGYVGALYASHTSWQQGGVLSLQLRPWRGTAYVGLSYTFFSSVQLAGRVNDVDVKARLVRHPAELTLGGEVTDGPLRWGPEVGVMIDSITREFSEAIEPLAPTASASHRQVVFGLRVRGTWFVGPGIGISSSLGVDLPTTRMEHVAAGEQGTVVLARQLSVRPRAELGVLMRLW